MNNFARPYHQKARRPWTWLETVAPHIGFQPFHTRHIASRYIKVRSAIRYVCAMAGNRKIYQTDVLVVKILTSTKLCVARLVVFHQYRITKYLISLSAR